MRKLSMKKPGTPEIEDSSASGSDGGRAEGEIAFRFARGPAEDPSPGAALWLPVSDLDLAGARAPAGGVPGLLPWDSWACTCGAEGSCVEVVGCWLGGVAAVELPSPAGVLAEPSTGPAGVAVTAGSPARPGRRARARARRWRARVEVGLGGSSNRSVAEEVVEEQAARSGGFGFGRVVGGARGRAPDGLCGRRGAVRAAACAETGRGQFCRAGRGAG